MSRQLQLNKIVGTLVAKKRDAAGLTQEDVAERINLGLEAYARIERGITPLTVSRLVKLADIFCCSITELVIETSTGISAQAEHIANLMDGLGTSDRDEVVKIVESVCAVAHKKYKKQTTK
ncbi:helix-turn-helix domain-containing protein [Paraburkholderia mimosarum]|uniref:helix-turn-helix domain-containing protein n=1 Tax=Paraburkholderia mimosarum TaxID=312026 RepID=UPI00047F9D73|nr:helix-turn-helix transcriptional regulator [Paraburkholderia mimosarum]